MSKTTTNSPTYFQIIIKQLKLQVKKLNYIKSNNTTTVQCVEKRINQLEDRNAEMKVVSGSGPEMFGVMCKKKVNKNTTTKHDNKRSYNYKMLTIFKAIQKVMHQRYKYRQKKSNLITFIISLANNNNIFHIHIIIIFMWIPPKILLHFFWLLFVCGFWSSAFSLCVMVRALYEDMGQWTIIGFFFIEFKVNAKKIEQPKKKLVTLKKGNEKVIVKKQK